MKRGDVILVRFPHPSGQRGKKRPAVVVQSNVYADVLSTIIVAEVTKNLTMKHDPACLFIDRRFPRGLIDSHFSLFAARSPIAKFDPVALQPRYFRTLFIQCRFTQNRVVAAAVEGDEQAAVR